MSLAQGRPYLAIPGPSVIPDRVLEAMQRGSPNIYVASLVEMVESLLPDLKGVAGTTGHVAIYLGNANAGLEAVNANIFSRGEKALVLTTGYFGRSWASSANAMGIEVEVMDFGKSTPVDFAQVEAVLRADRNRKIKAVLTTHVDPSSSIKTDIAMLRKVMDAVVHPALLAVDCSASLGCDEFCMDDWGVDVTVATCQQGLMTPPGLTFVWFSPEAREHCGQTDLATPYWAWGPRVDGADFWHLRHGLAPTAHFFGLRAAFDMIAKEGLPRIWHRHRVLAGTVWAAFEHWSGGNPQIALNVADAQHRACSVTTARFGAPHATRLRQWCDTKAGVTLGIGFGMAAPNDPAFHGFLRVGHMGHVNAHMVLGGLAVMEAGMQALAIPHGTGALAAAAQVVAEGVR